MKLLLMCVVVAQLALAALAPAASATEPNLTSGQWSIVEMDGKAIGARPRWTSRGCDG